MCIEARKTGDAASSSQKHDEALAAYSTGFPLGPPTLKYRTSQDGSANEALSTATEV